MATDKFCGVEVTAGDKFDGVIVGNGDKYDGVATGIASDSVSANPSYLAFYFEGDAYNTAYATITSSGSWTASIIYNEGCLISCTPSGGDQDDCFAYVGFNNTEGALIGIIRVVCGSAYVDISVCQDGTVETCA